VAETGKRRGRGVSVSAVLIAAMVWPALLLVLALLLGRLLRSADRLEEQRRCDAAAAPPLPPEPNADADAAEPLAPSARDLASS
jgi:hypothetical protein